MSAIRNLKPAKLASEASKPGAGKKSLFAPSKKQDARAAKSASSSRERKAGWRAISSLITQPPSDLLAASPKALQRVWPLSDRHRRQLPKDITELSACLTSERGQLKSVYWSRPGFVSAYLYYFLPWNLWRLASLLPNLSLFDKNPSPVLMDAGSGPLTLPIALWLARPDLRHFPLRVIALDSARQPLKLGMRLFQEIAGQDSPWQISLVTGPINALAKWAPREADQILVSACNVLNELPGLWREFDKALATNAEEERPEAESLARLLDAWAPLLDRPKARLLIVEPGTRLGGMAISALRELALERCLTPLSPCVHARTCPLGGRHGSWCHFVFSAQGAPEWLKNLSREAGLFKTSLSLAPLLLTSSGRGEAKGLPLRVISQKFPVSGKVCRYGCSTRGLVLLRDAAHVFSGDLCLGQQPEKPERDPKSGAIIVDAP